MTERVPDDRSHMRHVAIAALVGVVGAVLFGVGLWMAFRPDDRPVKQAEIEPAQPTAPSGTTTVTGGSPEPTSGAGTGSGTGSAGGSGTATGSQTVTTATGDRIVRAARIAFRLGATLYVANEDGSAATPVYRSDDGPYALSPDGKTIALVQDRALKLIDVATGDAASTGEAEEGMPPKWRADSSAVVYRRLKKGSSDQFDIWSAPRSGADPKRLGSGEHAALSPDGRVLVVLNSTGMGVEAASAVSVSVDGGVLKPITVSGGQPTAVATNGARVFVGLTDGERGSAVLSLKSDGSGGKQIASGVLGEVPAMWVALDPSPDGGLLMLQAHGDDGYARAYLVPTAGGEVIELTRRRDSEHHGWSATGERLFLIEGNAFQGEPTSLISVKRNGSARRDVVTGAQ